MLRHTKFTKPPSLTFLHFHFRSLTTASSSTAPPPPATPVKRGSPSQSLHDPLPTTEFPRRETEQQSHQNPIPPNPEFFLQVCNKFPYSWRPVYQFHQFSTSQPDFTHTSTTFNKTLDVVGKSRNLDLFWSLYKEAGERRLVNIKTYIIAQRTLAAARELKKCIEFFHLMKNFGYEYEIGIFNTVVEALCRNKLVNEARHVVVKMKDWIRADSATYR